MKKSKTAEYRVKYVSLGSDNTEKDEFFKSRNWMMHDVLGGFERELIYIEKDGKMVDAYSVIGYFTVYDGLTGDVEFKKERKWEEQEAKDILGEDALETIVNLDKDLKIPITEKEVTYNALLPGEEENRLSLERYLLENAGAFPILNEQHFEGILNNHDLYNGSGHFN